MTTGEKIAKLRKENNYTQEQLAEVLGVSRQSISKYESGISYPETEKLIRLGDLFQCSLDYLLRDDVEERNPMSTAVEKEEIPTEEIVDSIFRRVASLSFEKKSKRTLFGMPLWHVGKDAIAVIAVGLKAKGIIAIGFRSVGVISVGMLSIGVLALGSCAIGLLAAGALALGGVAAGAMAVGIVAVGAVAVGEFAGGALAIGHYFAYGEHANAMFAIGETKANGSIFEIVGDLTSSDKKVLIKEMYQRVPRIYHWIVKVLAGLV